eukprot:gnl/MRDRNA2_/MRDRNA2_61105_c0_seq1.p1 gnl/MRDRNA2_/MRDRNA2_61105_c0~~gnl/MRDRNA2_/MRDRNA2_61105_c0_seq1.p1  ORF type:complete len:226 (-),score=51.56 gnl/MRDRNA2_/MRDRNA2_61105_c0_seq1:122-799(-)
MAQEGEYLVEKTKSIESTSRSSFVGVKPGSIKLSKKTGSKAKASSSPPTKSPAGKSGGSVKRKQSRPKAKGDLRDSANGADPLSEDEERKCRSELDLSDVQLGNELSPKEPRCDILDVVLKKTEEKEEYGINVVQCIAEVDGQSGMVLTSVAKGKLLEKWSIHNLPASNSICSGDVIVAINGVSALDLDVTILRNASEMQLTIAHFVADNEERESLPTSKMPTAR